MIVYVESNFVLELALNQEQSKFAKRILSYANRQKVDLAIPAYGIAEPAWTLRSREERRERLLDEMSRDVQQLARSKARSHLMTVLGRAVETLRSASGEDHQQYDKVARKILACARVLELTTDSIREALRVRKRLFVTRHDSYILGSILVDLRRSGRSADGSGLFISRDKKLTKKEISDEFGKYDCRIFPDFQSACGFIGSRLS